MDLTTLEKNCNENKPVLREVFVFQTSLSAIEGLVREIEIEDMTENDNFSPVLTDTKNLHIKNLEALAN